MNHTLSRRRALVLASGALATPMLASGVARAADDWPNKPVRYINSFPAGGPTDVLSRVACQKLSELTGQQFIVENKGGSGGNVGADAIAHAAPDGYTIGLYSVASHAIAPTLYAKLPYDPAKDFTAITMLWSLPNLLIVRPGVPAKTVPELIKLARDNPGKYSFASSGSGTTVHLSGELFKYMAKIDLLHVPYRGSAPAIQDLLAGQVDMIFDNIPGSLAQMRGDKAVGPGRHLAAAQPGGAGDSGDGRVPAGLRHQFVGRHLRPRRPAAGGGREAVGAQPEGAGERRPQDDLPQAGRDAAVDEPGRHRRLPRGRRETAGAGDQGLGREGRVIAGDPEAESSGTRVHQAACPLRCLQ